MGESLRWLLVPPLLGAPLVLRVLGRNTRAKEDLRLTTRFLMRAVARLALL